MAALFDIENAHGLSMEFVAALAWASGAIGSNCASWLDTGSVVLPKLKRFAGGFVLLQRNYTCRRDIVQTGPGGPAILLRFRICLLLSACLNIRGPTYKAPFG